MAGSNLLVYFLKENPTNTSSQTTRNTTSEDPPTKRSGPAIKRPHLSEKKASNEEVRDKPLQKLSSKKR
ncbi:hypothetical protein JTE90_001940 [Oedothorax gibbosus]|uniref:Uncharacterized protein n=1 Tax=Oedothorax gibbosus TaxID=931172 RepID=A0AAV6VTR6_9ARAC|nr:hypothetical protein JTE90_001940 [Oedothorax gibbosus]